MYHNFKKMLSLSYIPCGVAVGIYFGSIIGTMILNFIG